VQIGRKEEPVNSHHVRQCEKTMVLKGDEGRTKQHAGSFRS